jgi:hypothetical protein
MLFVAPRNKFFLTFPMNSHFYILFYNTFYLSLQTSEKQNSSVGIATGCGLDERCSIPDRSKITLLSTSSQRLGVHLASYPMGTDAKVAGA